MSDSEDFEDQEEGVPDTVSNDVWRKLKKHKASIAVYGVSVLISVGVILTQQKMIREMNNEKQEMNKNIQDLQHEISKQHSINIDSEEWDTIDSNAIERNNGFWTGFRGAGISLAKHAVIGAVLGQ